MAPFCHWTKNVTTDAESERAELMQHPGHSHSIHLTNSTMLMPTWDHQHAKLHAMLLRSSMLSWPKGIVGEPLLRSSMLTWPKGIVVEPNLELRGGNDFFLYLIQYMRRFFPGPFPILCMIWITILPLLCFSMFSLVNGNWMRGSGSGDGGLTYVHQSDIGITLFSGLKALVLGRCLLNSPGNML